MTLELLLFVAAAIVAGVAALIDSSPHYGRLMAVALGLVAAGLAVSVA